MGNIRRAFGYIRLSKYDDKTTSLDRQREAVEALCSSRGWDLVHVFEDMDQSAYRGKHRPVLERMLSRLSEVDAIVYMRLDRIARSTPDFLRIKDRCAAAGVALVATSHPELDPTSSSGKAFEVMLAVLAEFESDQISDRAKAMHAKLREQGKHVGRVPFGFRREEGKLVPEPAQQAVLETVARRYIAGDSLRSIARDVGIHHPNLARMLRSEHVLSALPVEIASALSVQLAAKGRSGTRASASLMGGIARCAVCGGSMTVVGRSKRDGPRVPRSSYACKERGHVSISRTWLDDYVTEEVVSAINTGELARRMKKRRPRRRSDPSPILEARIKNLDEAYFVEGTLKEKDRYQELRERLLQKLSRAKEDEEETSPLLPLELAKNLGEHWEELAIQARRRIIGAVLKQVSIRKAKGHGPVTPDRVDLIWQT